MKEILTIAKCVFLEIFGVKCREFDMFNTRNCKSCKFFKKDRSGFDVCINNVSEIDCIKNDFKYWREM